jgi:hypothetical protein
MLLDSTRSKQNGRHQETNQANTKRNNTCGNNSNNSTHFTTPLVKWTSKTMVVKKVVRFSPEDWKKVTKAQKSQVHAFWNEKKTTVAYTTVSVKSTEIQPAPTPATITTQTTITPHTYLQTNSYVCHQLSYNTSRDSNSLPSQVVIDGRTSMLSFCDRAYSIHQNMQIPCCSLIDGGANGGHSRSDAVVLAETLFCCWPYSNKTWSHHWCIPSISPPWHW